MTKNIMKLDIAEQMKAEHPDTVLAELEQKRSRTFCLGHRNFGMLTTMVPHQNYKTYHSMVLAEKDCDELRKRNPRMKVLVCTPFGTPVRVATNKDRQ